MKKNILVIGTGGREHALCLKILQSPLLNKLYAQTGNAGIETIAETLSFDPCNGDAVLQIVQDYKIDCVIIGPEAPLAAGLVNHLESHNIPVFGPTKEAAQLESSKGFTKDLCKELNVPTAAYIRLTNAQSALDYIKTQKFPLVIKADGLAAGKGVVIADNLPEAEQAIAMMFDGGFGDAGTEIVIEEFLQGEEASFFVLCDGETAVPFGTAQDHKRIGDGDTDSIRAEWARTPPAPIVTQTVHDRVMEQIIHPIMQAMKEKNMPFKGVLYAGLMIKDEQPYLIEFNTRFGDPECQVLMMRLESDLLDILLKACEKKLHTVEAKWTTQKSLTVVVASKGYPESYQKNTIIEGLDTISEQEAIVFHAGTNRKDGQVLATGGRVLNVTVKAESVKEAQQKAYKAIEKIKWENGYYRRDIGWREIEREKNAA